MSDATDAPKTEQYARRLSDKILIAFHLACDQNNLEIARQLLGVFEFMLRRDETIVASGTPRRSLEGSLVAAYERLWEIRRPDPERQWLEYRTTSRFE